jgi:hypothetical protein
MTSNKNLPPAQYPTSIPEADLTKLRNEYVNAAAKYIAEWVICNYEDPVHHTPYESAEGGYQYINGGPYSVTDIIKEEFHSMFPGDDVPEEVVDAVIVLLDMELCVPCFGWE